MAWSSDVPGRITVLPQANASTSYSVRVVFDHMLLDGEHRLAGDVSSHDGFLVGAVYMLVGTAPWSEARTRADVTVRETLRDVLEWIGEETYPGPLLRAMRRHGLHTTYGGRVSEECATECQDDCGVVVPFGCGGCCGCLGGCRLGWEEQVDDEQRRRDLSTVDVLRGLS